MNPTTLKSPNLLLIGAGGVTSYLLFPLCKSFRPNTVTILDGDRLEEKNLTRQKFSEKQIGKYKAEMLVESHKDLLPQVVFNIVPRFFRSEEENHGPMDLIICAADNHQARRTALAYADKNNIPCVVAGNEFIDSEAYIYFPEWKNKPLDPRIRYPEILTNDEGSPFHCQDDEALESTPQLALANLGAACKVLNVMWHWFRAEINEDLRTVEYHSGITSDTRITTKELATK